MPMFPICMAWLCLVVYVWRHRPIIGSAHVHAWRTKIPVAAAIATILSVVYRVFGGCLQYSLLFGVVETGGCTVWILGVFTLVHPELWLGWRIWRAKVLRAPWRLTVRRLMTLYLAETKEGTPYFWILLILKFIGSQPVYCDLAGLYIMETRRM